MEGIDPKNNGHHRVAEDIFMTLVAAAQVDVENEKWVRFLCKKLRMRRKRNESMESIRERILVEIEKIQSQLKRLLGD